MGERVGVEIQMLHAVLERRTALMSMPRAHPPTLFLTIACVRKVVRTILFPCFFLSKNTYRCNILTKDGSFYGLFISTPAMDSKMSSWVLMEHASSLKCTLQFHHHSYWKWEWMHGDCVHSSPGTRRCSKSDVAAYKIQRVEPSVVQHKLHHVGQRPLGTRCPEKKLSVLSLLICVFHILHTFMRKASCAQLNIKPNERDLALELMQKMVNTKSGAMFDQLEARVLHQSLSRQKQKLAFSKALVAYEAPLLDE